MSLVSVIIPTYNRAYCLDRAIESVINQTYLDWELIIVDNYSSDDTDSLVSKYSNNRIRLLKIHNQGVIAASRNKGIRHSSGEYIAFLDSDDWWSPDKLTKSVESLDLGADIVYHDMFIYYPDRAEFKSSKKSKTRRLCSPIFNDLLLNGNGINNSSVVARSSVIKKIGGISEDRDLVASEDYDTWLRLSTKTERFKRLDGCFGWYTVGQNGMANADRFEKTLKKIVKLYPINGSKRAPPWMDYLLAHSYLKENRFKNSRHYAFKAMINPSGVIFFIKSFVVFILTFWKREK